MNEHRFRRQSVSKRAARAPALTSNAHAAACYDALSAASVQCRAAVALDEIRQSWRDCPSWGNSSIPDGDPSDETSCPRAAYEVVRELRTCSFATGDRVNARRTRHGVREPRGGDVALKRSTQAERRFS